MKKLSFASSLVALILSSSASASFMQIHDVIVPKLAVQEHEIEVIQVLGQRPIEHYRTQYKLAKKDFLQAYSKLTDIEDFKIDCGLNSRSYGMLSKSCTSNYIDRITAAHQNQSLELGSSRNRFFRPAYQSMALKSALAERKHEQAEDVLSKLKAHPKLLVKLNEMNVAMANYYNKKAEVFGQEWVEKSPITVASN